MPDVSVRSANADSALSNRTQGGTCARQAVLSYLDVAETTSVPGDVLDYSDLDMSVEELRSLVTASFPLNSVLIDIDVTGPDPELTADIANGVGQGFTDMVTTVLERTRAGGVSPVQISTVEGATAPSAPFSPNTTSNVARGFLLGLMLGLMLAVLWSVLGTRARSLKEVHEMRSPRAEFFRSLRTNLQLVNLDCNPQSVVLANSAPGEGRTTVSTNLASSLAQSGGSVALEDAGMRKPTLIERIGVDGEIGRPSTLAGMLALEDEIHRLGKDELFILSDGSIPPNPSELLGSREMQHLPGNLAEVHFDCLIIDSPPVLAVTDAAIVSRPVGGTILVAAIGISRMSAVVAALEALDGIANCISGGVVMRTRSKGPDSYHGARHEVRVASQVSHRSDSRGSHAGGVTTRPNWPRCRRSGIRSRKIGMITRTSDFSVAGAFVRASAARGLVMPVRTCVLRRVETVTGSSKLRTLRTCSPLSSARIATTRGALGAQQREQ